MVFVLAGTGRLGHRYYHRRRFERPHQSADHHHRRERAVPLHAQPDLLGMFLGLIGLAIAFDNLWLLIMLVPFAFVIRYGVVAREEAYLERKFGDIYRGYRSRVRRWISSSPLISPCSSVATTISGRLWGSMFWSACCVPRSLFLLLEGA